MNDNREIITDEELKERLKEERKKAIEKYLDLYIEGRITKNDLISALTE